MGRSELPKPLKLDHVSDETLFILLNLDWDLNKIVWKIENTNENMNVNINETAI